MIDKGKVSIIIPVYNVENYIHDCLNSIISQTYKNIEIILIDDGSTDLSSVTCRKFEYENQNVKYLFQKNQGISAARNTGLEVCTGEYIYWLDPDDYIYSNTIEILVNEMEDTIDIVSASFQNVGEEDKFQNIIATPPKFCITTSKVFYFQIISNHSWGKLYRRGLFSDVRYPINQNYEDVATTHKLFHKANKIKFTKEKLYFYRIRKGAITQTLTEKNITDYIASYKNVKEYYSTFHNEEIDYYLMTILYGIYSKALRSGIYNKKKYLVYIRQEFKSFNNIELTNFIDAPMTYKLILYKYRLSYIPIKFMDIFKTIKSITS